MRPRASNTKLLKEHVAYLQEQKRVLLGFVIDLLEQVRELKKRSRLAAIAKAEGREQ